MAIEMVTCVFILQLSYRAHLAILKSVAKTEDFEILLAIDLLGCGPSLHWIAMDLIEQSLDGISYTERLLMYLRVYREDLHCCKFVLS